MEMTVEEQDMKGNEVKENDYWITRHERKKKMNENDNRRTRHERKGNKNHGNDDWRTRHKTKQNEELKWWIFPIIHEGVLHYKPREVIIDNDHNPTWYKGQ